MDRHRPETSERPTAWPATGPAVVKAWAPWCGSCRALAPVVDRVAGSAGVPLVPLQIDADPEMVDRLGLRSVPTLVALRDGAEVGRLVGLQSAAAVQSLFALVAAGDGRLDHRAPAPLLAARALAGVALLGAGLVAGSVVLGLIGVAALGWAAFGLVRR
ncbi:MAG: thioredoxin family protein [Acidimicrobiia bacterium]|nr:thioredoxin family protein [Acidimicrobiia bacterium]